MQKQNNKPGQVIVGDSPIIINKGRSTVKVWVDNSGDRPIQVGSHYHFYETNPALIFDRDLSKGYRLNIVAGTAVRFEPGQGREVELVQYAGKHKIVGFRGDVMGQLEPSKSTDDSETSGVNVDRDAYAQMFGPTVGDRVRLADTSLWIKVEKDYTTYGDEVKFGGVNFRPLGDC